MVNQVLISYLPMFVKMSKIITCQLQGRGGRNMNRGGFGGPGFNNRNDAVNFL